MKFKEKCKEISSMGTYAIVQYDGGAFPIWITRFSQWINGEDWYLESPCELRKVCQVSGDLYEFGKQHVSDFGILLDCDENEYIRDFVIPLVVDGVFYEIENYQCSPFIPEEVDSLEFITERECLLWMLNHPTR